MAIIWMQIIAEKRKENIEYRIKKRKLEDLLEAYGLSGESFQDIEKLVTEGHEESAKLLFAKLHNIILKNKLNKEWRLQKNEYKADVILNDVTENATSYYSHHLPILYNKRRELIYEDEFGDIHEELWDNYIDKYYEEKLYPMLPKEEVAFLENVDRMNEMDTYSCLLKDRMIFDVKWETKEYKSPSSGFGYYKEMSGMEYESYCKELMEYYGWDVRKTPPTGDRGADLIAKKNGVAIAVQCKRYSGKVGNKAIQEAHSAKGIYCTDHAAVITDSTFTPQVVMDANALGVKLAENNMIEKIGKY